MGAKWQLSSLFNMKYTIDATGKRIGRVASEAASLLMGKNISSFVRNAFPSEVSVEIINTSKSEIDQKKIRQKTYAKYSGYPGGLRHEKMSDLITKKCIVGQCMECCPQTN